MFLKEEGQIAEAQAEEWQNKMVQIGGQLQVVGKKMREIYGSQQKPRKTKNYALKKVEEPPSDNE